MTVGFMFIVWMFISIEKNNNNKTKQKGMQWKCLSDWNGGNTKN